MAENIAVPYEVYARQQLAKEMAELAGKPLDEAPQGGRYLGADGKLHDAHGNVLEAEATASAFEIATATRDELEAEAARRGLSVAGTGKDGYVTVEDYRKALA